MDMIAPVAWCVLQAKIHNQDGWHVASQDSLSKLQLLVVSLMYWTPPRMLQESTGQLLVVSLYWLAAPQESMGMFLVLWHAKIVLLGCLLVKSQAALSVSSVIKGSTACWAGLSAVE
jgi:hypothetical protein